MRGKQEILCHYIILVDTLKDFSSANMDNACTARKKEKQKGMAKDIPKIVDIKIS